MVNATIKITWSEKVEYTDNNVESIPSTGGVFEIQGKKKEEDRYTRRYVGKSNDLKDTYAKFLKGRAANDKLNQFLKEKRSFFRYVKVKSDPIQKDVVKGLYSKYRHSLIDNTDAPAGSGKYAEINVEEKNN